MRIKNKLVLIFISIVLVPMVIATVIAAHIVRTRMGALLEDKVDFASQVVRNTMHELENENLSLAEGILSDPEVALYLAVGRYEQLNNVLPSRLKRINADRLTIIDKLGNIIARAGRSDIPEDFPRVYNEASPINTIRTVGEGLFITSIVPVKRQENLEGLLVLDTGLDKEIASSIKAIVGSEISFLREGKLIASTSENKNATESREIQLLDKKGNLIGTLEVRLSILDALAAQDSARSQLLGIALIFTVIAGVVGIFLARAISRPLAKLVKATQKLALGDISAKAEITSKDEIGELAQSFNDMTEKLRITQEQLIQAGKMSAVGQLAGGVAHEINNPLSGVLGYAKRLLKKVNDDSSRRDLGFIIDSALRCKDITGNLLEFSRISSDEYGYLDINNIIKKTISLVENSLKNENIELKLDLHPNPPQIYGNSNKLQQVFLNIIINAQQSMQNGGSLTLTTTRIPTDKERIHTNISDDSCSRGFVEIRVSDTGCGIPRENLDKIFNPFFTTRPPGKGTGLGLSLSYKIIQDHKGKIEVMSEPGKGTTFIVNLPIMQLKNQYLEKVSVA